jgi:hypothetical protein
MVRDVWWDIDIIYINIYVYLFSDWVALEDLIMNQKPKMVSRWNIDIIFIYVYNIYIYRYIRIYIYVYLFSDWIALEDLVMNQNPKLVSNTA